MFNIVSKNVESNIRNKLIKFDEKYYAKNNHDSLRKNILIFKIHKIIHKFHQQTFDE